MSYFQGMHELIKRAVYLKCNKNIKVSCEYKCEINGLRKVGVTHPKRKRLKSKRDL